MKTITIISLALISGNLFASNGMQPVAIGAKAKAMAGAGLALPANSLIGGYNPAGIAEVGSRFDASLSTFVPTRSYSTSSEVIKTDGNKETESKNPVFFIPSIGSTKKINDRSTFGATMYAKGGGSVAYKNTATFAKFGALSGTQDGTGVWTYSEVQQMGLALNYAYKLNADHIIAAGPVLGFQRFKVTGLGYFKAVSNDPDHLTDNGWDNSLGYGAAIGYLGHFGPYVDFASAYHSKLNMTPFKKYAGLIAESGKMDMPAQYMVGFGLHPTSRLSFAFDYHVIKYTDVPSMSNSHSNELVAQDGATEVRKTIGGADGAGFGWSDVKIYKIGTAYEVDKSLTLRAGYSYGNSPIGSEDVLFNILAPAVTKQHLAVGLTQNFGGKYDVDFAYVRTLKNTVTGNNPKNNVNDNIALSMEQHDFEIGLSMLF